MIIYEKSLTIDKNIEYVFNTLFNDKEFVKKNLNVIYHNVEEWVDNKRKEEICIDINKDLIPNEILTIFLNGETHIHLKLKNKMKRNDNNIEIINKIKYDDKTIKTAIINFLNIVKIDNDIKIVKLNDNSTLLEFKIKIKINVINALNIQTILEEFILVLIKNTFEKIIINI